MVARSNLRRRLNMVMRSIGERGSTMLQALFPGQGPPAPRDAKSILANVKNLPWLQATAYKVMRTTASQRWCLYYRKGPGGKAVMDRRILRMAQADRKKALQQGAATGEYVELEEHPLLDALEYGNADLTGGTVRSLTTGYLDFVGETFWLIERGALNVPCAFWPVPTNWIEATPTPQQPYYALNVGGMRDKIPVTEVLYFKNPDPANPYGRGMGLATALADELEADEFAAKHINAWFKNRARPDFLVMGKIAPADTKRLEREWAVEHRGFWNAFKPRFLSGTDFQIHEMNQSFQSMQLVDIRKFGRDYVSQVWGVPLEIMGIVEHSNRSTIDVADYLFMRHTIVPRLELYREVMQRDLVPMFDERLILDYDDPVPEDLEFMLKVMEKSPWAFTQDEWRMFAGHDELSDDRGQVFMVPANLIPSTDLRTLDVVATPVDSPPDDQPPADDTPPADDSPSGDDMPMDEPPPDDGEGGSGGASGKGCKPKPGKPKRGATRFANGGVITVKVSDVVAGEITDYIPAWRVRGEDEDIPSITIPEPRLTAQDIQIIENSADPQALHLKVRPALSEAIKHFGDLAIREAGLEISFDLADPRVLMYLRKESAERIKNLVNRTTKKRIRDTLTEGVNAGESMEDLQKRLVKVYADARGYRSHNIARTETHRAANFGSYEGYRDAGVQKVQWVITAGGNHRELHKAGRKLYNQVRALGQPFENDAGQKALYPGSFGDPGQDCQCQCRVIAYFGKSLPEATLRALWKDFIQQEQPFIRMYRAGLRKGFDEQQAAVLATFERVAGGKR